MIATQSPPGSGWVDNSWATSNASVNVGVRITPDCSNNVATAASEMGATFTRNPSGTPACRPDFTAITGFLRASERASLANLRGLPNDSR